MSNAPARVTKNKPLERRKVVGLWIFVLTNIFCADEMVPGWAMFHVGWPVMAYYAISIVGGAVGGAIFGGRYLLPGLIGGAIAGPGALFMVGKYLGSVDVSHSAIDCLMALVGTIPGVVIGLLLRVIQERMTRAKAAA